MEQLNIRYIIFYIIRKAILLFREFFVETFGSTGSFQKKNVTCEYNLINIREWLIKVFEWYFLKRSKSFALCAAFIPLFERSNPPDV